ncbi:trypsin-like peptidase domain-containing protein [Sorangium cellulosum]|uniref:trypsin-like peptidase domain-containing protein n=1 Tax=Sorangium cellulosum TaxID=56 RepID=UPI001F185898|nr:trypsin-like peptidase domain-containing protein [Sorangium cellulosum]
MAAPDLDEQLVGEVAQPSICGTTADFQHVEQYDGTLGVTAGFVGARESPVGQIQWKSDLASRYANPGNVSGTRTCSGTLIAHNLFLTAGHCFDPDGNGWTWPRTASSTPISASQGAVEMRVNFDYQEDPSGNLRTAESFDIVSLREHRLGGLDYAVVQLARSAAASYGFTVVSTTDAAVNDMLAVIGHPSGEPKQVDAGPATSFSGDYIQYGSLDTLGGNSGSGVLHAASGKIVGVHTNGGCTSIGGANSGVRITSILEESPILRDVTQRLVVFAKGSDNAIWHKFYDGGWSSWTSLGGSLTSSPSATLTREGRLTVFAKGSDNAIWHKYYDGGWSGWTSLGGPLASAPAATVTREGRLTVFARGTDNAIWHKYYDGGWSGWTSLGGPLASAPAATVTREGRLTVFARGTDNAIWHKYYDGGWSSWISLGGATTHDPAAVVTAEGRLVVFARSSSGELVHRYYDGGWSSWISLGGAIASGPSAVVTAEGRLTVFARGADNAIWHKYYDGGWSGWISLGGAMVDQPGSAVTPEGRLVVFARGTDNAIWHKYYDGGWSSWISLGGALTSSPAGI